METIRRSRVVVILTALLAAVVALTLVFDDPAEARKKKKKKRYTYTPVLVDQNQIVFASNRTTGTGVDNPTGDLEIFSMNSDGTGLKQITKNEVIDKEPPSLQMVGESPTRALTRHLIRSTILPNLPTRRST